MYRKETHTNSRRMVCTHNMFSPNVFGKEDGEKARSGDIYTCFTEINLTDITIIGDKRILLSDNWEID